MAVLITETNIDAVDTFETRLRHQGSESASFGGLIALHSFQYTADNSPAELAAHMNSALEMNDNASTELMAMAERTLGIREAYRLRDCTLYPLATTRKAVVLTNSTGELQSPLGHTGKEETVVLGTPVMAGVRALLGEENMMNMFNKYDYDCSGNINSNEELTQLTINMLYACEKEAVLAVSVEAMANVTAQIELLELSDNNAWTMSEFEPWFDAGPLAVARNEADRKGLTAQRDIQKKRDIHKHAVSVMRNRQLSGAFNTWHAWHIHKHGSKREPTKPK